MPENQLIDLPLSEIIKRVTIWSPPVDNLQVPGQTLRDYFAPLRNWQPSEEYPQQERAITLISTGVERRYGESIARRVTGQLHEHPICDTGPHTSFPRDYDHPNHPGTTYNDYTWQSILSAGALYRDAGLQYHLGAYTSLIPVACGNGAEFVQLTPHHAVRAVGSRKASGSVMTTPALIDGKPTASGGEISLGNLEADYEAYYLCRRAEEALALLEKVPSMDPARICGWQTFLRRCIDNPQNANTSKNAHSLGELEGVLVEHGLKIQDYTPYLNDARESIDRMRNPLASGFQNPGFNDQVAAVQTRLLNKILPPDIREVAIDAYSVTRQLMIEALRNPSSLFHQIFADLELRDRFVYELAGGRSGWSRQPDGGVESPFLIHRASKGPSSTLKIDYETHRAMHTPEELADNLERGTIITTCALEVAFLPWQTGILTHGGPLQSVCARDMRAKLCAFLENVDCTAAERTRRMTLDINLQATFVGMMEYERPLRISDLLEVPLSLAEAEGIPEIDTESSFALGAPTLHDFFTYYESSVTGNAFGQLLNPECARHVYRSLQNTSGIIIRPRSNDVTRTPS